VLQGFTADRTAVSLAVKGHCPCEVPYTKKEKDTAIKAQRGLFRSSQRRQLFCGRKDNFVKEIFFS